PRGPAGVLTPFGRTARGPSAGFANTFRADTGSDPRGGAGARSPLSPGIAVGHARPRTTALPPPGEKIYSGDSRNPGVPGITFKRSATHSRHATGTDAELAKEDEIPQ